MSKPKEENNIELEVKASKHELESPKDKKKKKSTKTVETPSSPQDDNNNNNNNTVKTKDIRELYDMKAYNGNITALVTDLITRYPEIQWLTSKTNVTPEGIISSKDQKLSVQLYGETHIEFDKTVVSIFCLFWLMSEDYDSFIACQPPPAKLTRKSFDELRNYVISISRSAESIEVAKRGWEEKERAGRAKGKKPSNESEWAELAESQCIEAIVVFTVLNDLGKVESVVQLVRAKTAVEEVDHDKILWMGLKTNPNLFPSYTSLEKKYQDWLLEGLGAQFNFAQLVQAESVPAGLSGVKGLSKMSLDLFNLHALFDMAGAAGHVKYNGSVVLLEATYQDIMLTIRAMELIPQGATVTQVYDNYLHERGKALGLDVHRPSQRALLRLCCNLRYHTPVQAKAVVSAYEKLPKDIWNSLRKELCTTGVDDGIAILLYYAPALLLNCQAAAKATADAPSVEKIEIGMRALHRCFEVARSHIQSRKGFGVFTADIADIANLAKTPDSMEKARFSLNAVGEDGKITARFDEDVGYK